MTITTPTPTPKKRPTNAPMKGDTITVDPIRSRRHIADIKRVLADTPRDLCLFIVGINVALRASDLVTLTVGQVRDLAPGDILRVSEQKTRGRKPPRPIPWNAAAAAAVAEWLPHHPQPTEASYLWPSNKHAGGGGGRPLTVAHIHKLVKGWARRVGAPGNYGSHSLRKTWGYHQWHSFGTHLAVIQVALGHTRPSTTMRYLGIQSKDVELAYMNAL